MPALQVRSPIVALLVADLHLSIKPPPARSDEPSWFAAMERSFSVLRDLAKKHKALVLCAGDVFDQWNSPPELINWALERLPTLHAIPGNHDLPNHRPDLAHRSAYGTLVRAGKIIELGPWPIIHKRMAIYGRSFGEFIPRLHKTAREHGIKKHILVTHEYLWTAGTGYPGAPRESKLSTVARSFRGFDVVVVGDNHVSFDRYLKSGTRVVNCGSFLRRKSNEKEHRPRIGLLHSSGFVSFHRLPIRDERMTGSMTTADEREERLEPGVDSFVEALSNLSLTSLDYRDNLIRAIKAQKIRRKVRDAILEAMGA